ncbi:MAG: hypothetical protein VYD87_04155 [Pseudomonadota bacterium]|nr:hypothetical protein [Pseudomonadota bacterium]
MPAKFPAAVVAAALAAFCAAPAHALTLMGDVVSGAFGVTGETPFLDMTAPVMDPGSEFIYGDRVTANLTDWQLTITYDFVDYLGESAPTEWTLGDLDFAPAARITGFSLVSGPAKMLVETRFTDDSLTASFRDMVEAGYTGVNTFVFAFEAEAVAQAPLPAALPMALAGFGALAGAARLRRARGRAAA